MRSASLLEYLRARREVHVAAFHLRRHSKSFSARVLRNAARLLRGSPPLFDRFSRYEAQIAAQLTSPRYAAAVVEHFWCASYAPLLRPRAERLILDLHNVESQLARTHARVAAWPQSWAWAGFARAYERLERQWLPQFDLVLVASEDDRWRVRHPNVHVYPNAIPLVERPRRRAPGGPPALIFTGNLEYHPNVEAVRWFRSRVWPLLRARAPALEWRLAGVNPSGVERLVAADARIRLVGPFEHAAATLAQADVAIVPVRSGSGTRFKILEAWAAACPVVSTPLGAEGLEARDGEHLLLAHEPAAFAEAILRLLDDPGLRARLGDAGRALYLERYTWSAAWRKLDAVLGPDFSAPLQAGLARGR
jgi:glycosyltransferase involved in cell wall biosynthesis